MDNPVQAMKQLFSPEQKTTSQTTESAQKPFATASALANNSSASIDPASLNGPIKAYTSTQTELMPSAPIAAPAIAAFEAARSSSTDSEIATAADAEAGVPLTEAVSAQEASPMQFGSSPGSVTEAVVSQLPNPIKERHDSGVAIAADAEAGVPLSEVVSASSVPAFERAKETVKPASEEIAVAADAEAGVSLNEVMPKTS